MAEHSNEQTALPRLLEQLELAGCIVSIDAMGCLPKIATQIKEQDGEYVLVLKANQGTLYQDVIDLFADALTPRVRPWCMTMITPWTKDMDGSTAASIGRLLILIVSPISMPKRPGLGYAALGWETAQRRVGE